MSDINNGNRYLFRGKPKGRIERERAGVKIGEWVFGHYSTQKKFERVRHYIQLEGKGEPIFVQVDSSTVGQFTGANDKDGVKIFEGDIVRVHGEANYTISWNLDYCRFEFTNFGIFTTIALCAYRPDFYDKLGNIWDNTELLE